MIRYDMILFDPGFSGQNAEISHNLLHFNELTKADLICILSWFIQNCIQNMAKRYSPYFHDEIRDGACNNHRSLWSSDQFLWKKIDRQVSLLSGPPASTPWRLFKSEGLPQYLISILHSLQMVMFLPTCPLTFRKPKYFHTHGLFPTGESNTSLLPASSCIIQILNTTDWNTPHAATYTAYATYRHLKA